MRSISQIIELACDLFDADRDDILSPSNRRSEICAVRAAVCWAIVREREDMSIQTIAEQLNLRDRKSVYNGIERAERLASTSSLYKKLLDELCDVRSADEQSRVATRCARCEQMSKQPDIWSLLHVHLRGTYLVISA